MSDIVVFAGTREGRKIAEFLNEYRIPTLVCTATEYGESLLPSGSSLTLSHERLDAGQMQELFNRERPMLVIDATHPYAAEVTKNIKAACEAADIEYCRLLREGYSVTDGDVISVQSVDEAVDWIKENAVEGNILATTGSKELFKYTKIPDFRERVFARVLSLPQVAVDCAALGFDGKHLICMQGPFSRELNIAMLHQYDCKYLVTKESGSTGGFMEKYDAAREAGARLILIGRPFREEGRSLIQCKAYIRERFNLAAKQEITLIGIGMGNEDGMTREAWAVSQQADLLIGAKRMTEQIMKPSQEVYHAYKPDDIAEYIREHSQYEKIAVLLSGDVGFYSGAKKLLKVLPEDTKLMPGISSMISFMSKIKIPWEDTVPCSLHGRSVNLISLVKSNKKVFAIVGNKDGIGEICEKFCDYGMDHVRIWIGEKLSYSDEKISMGTVREFRGCKTDPLSVMLLVNDRADEYIVTHGISDTEFLRDKAPMTKEEVRAISLSKLRLKKDSVIYDVGAGTGSVSIEMALQADQGAVYAIEKKPDAVALLHRNREKFAADHLSIIEGLAPEACEELPAPTHAFIGGSSGNLKEIMELLLRKNPKIRVVINCITLETVAETLECLRSLPLRDVDIAQVSVGKSKEIGRYHMMMGQNPVYIISCEGGD